MLTLWVCLCLALQAGLPSGMHRPYGVCKMAVLLPGCWDMQPVPLPWPLWHHLSLRMLRTQVRTDGSSNSSALPVSTTYDRADVFCLIN